MTEMKNIDHTNPYTDEPFDVTYRRGQIVAADGGRDDARRRSSDDEEGDEDERETMEDVPHEPPNEGAKRTFERGTEGRDESV